MRVNQLAMWMRDRMLEKGAVPFVQFMEWALYHPEWGYYTGERRKFGKEGDFYTSPGVNPVFAEVLADDVAGRLVKLAAESGREAGAADGAGGAGAASEKEQAARNEPFCWIEFGAGDGRLARDVLARLKEGHPELFAELSYRIVEISPSLRELQRATIGEELAEKVVWLTEEELQAGAPYRGAVVTNELVDAYPVHRVVQGAEGLQELYAAWDAEAERFTEQTGPLSDSRIEEYLAAYSQGRKLVQGQVAEVGLPGLDWYRRALALLREGCVLTVDYGFEAEMLYHPSRMKGTLRGFSRHQVKDDPYADVGEQDLTADVNFTALRGTGEELGWRTDFFGSQSRYLLEAGILQRMRDTMHVTDLIRDPDMKRNRAIKQLILPGGMGDHFKVLVQCRNG